MAEISEKEIKEHLDSIVNALYALSPTRNRVLQLLELLDQPQDYPKMEKAYPGLFKDERVKSRLKDILGIKISDTVYVGSGLGYRLKQLSESVRSSFFGGYIWEEAQKKLSEYLGRELPNVEDELWEHKIQMAISEPTYGEDCKKVLRTMTSCGEGDHFKVDLAKVIENTGIERGRVLEVKNFMTQKPLGILESIEGEFRVVYGLRGKKDLLKKHVDE